MKRADPDKVGQTCEGGEVPPSADLVVVRVGAVHEGRPEPERRRCGPREISPEAPPSGDGDAPARVVRVRHRPPERPRREVHLSNSILIIIRN